MNVQMSDEGFELVVLLAAFGTFERDFEIVIVVVESGWEPFFGGFGLFWLLLPLPFGQFFVVILYVLADHECPARGSVLRYYY